MKCIVLACIIILIMPHPALALEGTIQEDGEYHIMPISDANFETGKIREIEYRNLVEGLPIDTTYDQVTLEYTMDEEGAIDSVMFSNSDGESFIISRIDDDSDASSSKTRAAGLPAKNSKSNIQAGLALTNRSDTESVKKYKSAAITDEKKKEPPVTTIYTTQPLEPLVNNPSKIDIGKIAKGLKDVSKEREKAYDNYVKNSDSYYKKMIEILKNCNTDLKEEGIDAQKVLLEYEGKSPIGPVDNKTREAVDETVRYIRQAAGDGIRQKTAATSIALLEQSLYDDHLKPSFMIYEKELKETIKYLNSIIDEIIKSKLAVYLDASKDKIEAIVQLSPEAE